MMALDAMELSLTEVDVDMNKSEHKCPAISMANPLQTLPVFQDQELTICDSHAISAYLASRYRCNRACAQLYPADPGGRALVDQLMFYNCGVLYPRYRAAADPLLYENESTVNPQQVNNIECAYADLEALLGPGQRDWFGGPWPTLGDISLGATVSTLHCLAPIDPQRFPILSTWLCRLSEQSFYITANQKGLGEFVQKLGCCVVEETDNIKCQRSSERRRYLAITKNKCES